MYTPAAVRPLFGCALRIGQTGERVRNVRWQTIALGVIGLVAAAWEVYMQNGIAKFASMTSKLGPHWDNLVPEMRARASQVISTLWDEGLVVGIPWNGGWRSIDEQKGISKSATNVVDPLDSYHVWGLACDFVPINAAGEYYWPPASDPVWQKIGAAIKLHGLEWGGDWSSIEDMPHGELKLATLSMLKAAYADPMAYVKRENSGGILA